LLKERQQQIEVNLVFLQSATKSELPVVLLNIYSAKIAGLPVFSISLACFRIRAITLAPASCYPQERGFAFQNLL